MEQWNQVKQYIEQKIEWMASREKENALKAKLAEMRRGIGKKPGELPELWGMLFENFPVELYGRGKTGEPSRAEWAVYLSLTLFAIHQQGRDIRKDCMHQEGVSLGTAVRRLAGINRAVEDDFERIRRRFNIIATSADIEELAHHLRGMVQLLKNEGVSLDYGLLGRDIYFYQNTEKASSVRLQWGRDFYRIEKKEQEDSNE